METNYLKVEMKETGVSVELNGTLIDLLYMLSTAALSIQEKMKLDDEAFSLWLSVSMEAARKCYGQVTNIDLTNLIKNMRGE